MYDDKHQNTIRSIESLSFYARKFQRLRVDRAHGIAPHKPILLLSVIELIRKGIIEENKIYLTDELVKTFLKYWASLGSESHNPDISKPFFHMRSGKFWHLWANPGFESVISSKVKLKTLYEVKQAIKYAYLDEDLFEFLQDSLSRNSLTIVLGARWFPNQLDDIEAIVSKDELP